MLTAHSLFKPAVSFRLITCVGILIGLWLYSIQSEQIPLSSLLTEKNVYLISFLTVIGFHVLFWIIVDKASFYDIAGYFFRIIRDTVIINCIVLSTVATCFLIQYLFFTV